MNKLVLSLAVIGALGLSACDSETIEDVTNDTADNDSGVVISARVIFDPSNGVLSVPNDILFTDTLDGTLNIPVDDEEDFSDPQNALNVLDGWSTQNPFVLDIGFPEGVSLDGNSVFNPSSVRIFEAIMGGGADECATVTRGLACKVVGELAYTTDFITQKSGKSVAVIPLKPLKPATTYLLVMTDNLLDDRGTAIAGSTTYELVQQDIATKPLGSDSQLALQGAINSYEAAVVSAGVDKESIIYSMAMTTQSVGTVLGVTKQLLATGLDPEPANVVVPLPVIVVADAGMSVAEKLIEEGILSDENPAHEPLINLHQAATLSTGTITLPYYLSAPDAENQTAPLNTWWKARCDSGAMLAGLAASNPSAIPEAPISPNDGFCMAFGLRDLGIDAERNLTKFNPIPVATTANTLEVQVTVPDLATVNFIRANLAKPLDPIEEPEGGWPVVILAHGIPMVKEQMLLTTGSLALQGLATIAIDHPLHGSRGYGPMNAAIDPLAYMNLASLPTLRDNLRQSVTDLLGLRFGINFLAGANIDKSRVHFLGQSLGAITGVDFLSLTNSPIAGAPEQVNAMFKVQASTLSVPVQGLAHALLESLSFGDLLKANVAMAGSEDLVAAVMAAAAQAGIEPNGDGWNDLVVQVYLASLQQLTEQELADLNGVFSQFAFAAQTMLDSGDPTNYALALAANETPLHVIEIVGGLDLGDAGVNGPDRLYPNQASSMPLGGTEPLITLLELPPVSATVIEPESFISAAVRFVGGDHSSLFSPLPTVTSPDAAVSARATQEMQTQVAYYLSSNGHILPITDTPLVLAN